MGGCGRSSQSEAPASLPDEPSPLFRNVEAPTAYVGDAGCTSCHAPEASTYAHHAMSRSFHRWTPAGRIEAALDTPLFHRPAGFYYTVVEEGNHLYQVEFILGAAGKRIHELRRRMEAVRLDPALAEAMSPLLEVRTRGNVVIGVSSLGSPITSLPVRARGPRAVRLSVTGAAESPGVVFANGPARGLVQLFDPDGSLVRAISAGDQSTLTWNLLTDAGVPVGGGLYRAVVEGRDQSGRMLPAQAFYFGIVRERGER